MYLCEVQKAAVPECLVNPGPQGHRPGGEAVLGHAVSKYEDSDKSRKGSEKAVETQSKAVAHPRPRPFRHSRVT